ncbi:DNA-3-methyladenine glycosylase 2 family protein [Geobacter sp. AOG2]|uniref:DNA-3-methyladenine glycosylase 2 family protein n=1 Tax=Geobacter sp. AOG2 TaxID=1566347 RepID=UPI001CC73F1D|nr:AlkA N-terminal domain-containing protein [Geobacter sp. AOG2]GFE59648.1 AraC family transcriptional regulator [Geobacter sp. AOG2]
MLLDATACYTALRARDSRFDGCFFVGVASTGIYCRPVCRARTPKAENCSFYVSAAAAEAAGFRPCLRCRPELAPGLARVDAERRLARLAALRMESDGLSDGTISDMADSLGITGRHLRRVFTGEYGVPPVAWLQTQRLLAAKQLLTETTLPIMQVAMNTGFGSVRRLNSLFRTRYGCNPTDFRKNVEARHDPAEPMTLLLGYRPPLAWETLLKFLNERAIPGVEYVDASRYLRTVSITHKGATHRGWISVSHRPARNVMEVTLSPSLYKVINRVLARVRFLFDLNCMPDDIAEKLGTMQIGGERVFEPGLRLPGCFDPFEMATRVVLGQQITVRAARTLAMRIATHLGEPLETPFRGLSVTFPTVERICSLERPIEDLLGPLGVVGARARSIRALAEAMRQGIIRLEPGADPEREMVRMAALPGFGPWTVQYLAMRALGWPDAFPHTDYGVKRALMGLSSKEMLALAQGWSPWRSYATLSLWNHLA